MTLDRRAFLLASGAAAGAALAPRLGLAAGAFAPRPGDWRRFEVTTRLEIAAPSGRTQAWVPLPSVNEAGWFRSEESTWTGNAATAEIVRDAKYGAGMLHAIWAEGESAPVLEVTSRIAARDRAVDLSAPGAAPALSDAERTLYTSATSLIPVDGIVKATSDKIVAGAGSQLDKARAIYDWIVISTYRDANVRGCGIGDISTMLEGGNLGGKCADLNALFVGLARAAGLPARDIYGIRVAPSRFGYASLGAKNGIITKSQHCRAEVFLDGFGWVPVDPADVRKVMLEEPPGNLSPGDAKVIDARDTLFGAWETNWLAYNFAHDVTLPGAEGPSLGFLMYPQAETGGARLDCLDPDGFAYRITARELTTA
jgi:transglutaminase-like putative cysteine protease